MSKQEEKVIEVTYWRESGKSWLALANKWRNNPKVCLFCCQNAEDSFNRMDKAKEASL